jgi:hypothetical protein
MDGDISTLGDAPMISENEVVGTTNALKKLRIILPMMIIISKRLAMMQSSTTSPLCSN